MISREQETAAGAISIMQNNATTGVSGHGNQLHVRRKTDRFLAGEFLFHVVGIEAQVGFMQNAIAAEVIAKLAVIGHVIAMSQKHKTHSTELFYS